MKHEGFVKIANPRSEVVKYFTDPNYLGEYQNAFVINKLLSGVEGQKGVVSKLYYKRENGKYN